MAEISAQVVSELRTKFERHDIWLWYDSQGNYTGVIDSLREALEGDGVNVAVYDGSYLDMKRRVWEDDPDLDQQWLFYIPASKNDAEWFADFDSLGKQYRTSAEVGDSPAAQFLIERESDIPDEFDDWGQNSTNLSKAFFCVLFETVEDSPKEWIVRYLNTPAEYRETINEYAQADAWANLLSTRFGIDAELDPDAIATQILFGEVHHHAPTTRYSELAADDGVAIKELCEYWQQHDSASYVRYAREIESEYDLRQAVRDSGDVHWSATAFRGIDRGLAELMLETLNDADYINLPDVAATQLPTVEDRLEAFWHEEGYASYWPLLEEALRTLRGVGAATDRLDSEAFGPSQIRERYAEEWWEVDANYRRYIQAGADEVTPVPGLSSLKSRVTQQYMDFLKAVNRPLAEGVGDEPQITTPQVEFFDRYADAQPKTAIFICDGLRYELAQELQERLAYDFEHQLDGLSATLPCVTEVGMAAHLPGQLELGIEGDELEISVDGTPMNTKQDRVARFEALGFEVNDLSAVLDTPFDALQQAEPIPRIIYSGIIDKLGENLDDDEALAQAEGNVTQVQNAIQRLRHAGYERFIVTADHGFLFTDRLTDELKLEAPDLAPIVKRRFAAAGSDAPLVHSGEYVTLEDAQLETLGLDAAGLQLLFPRSVACFKARGGNMRYFHGGISIQELLVPCLTVTTGAIDEEGSVSFAVEFPTTITNTIVSIDIEARTEQLQFDHTPTVVLRATVDNEPVAEETRVELSPGSNEARLRLKTGALGDAETVLFEAIDADSRETLQRTEATIDMIIRDDMGFDV